jgi:hypothetical protein
LNAKLAVCRKPGLLTKASVVIDGSEEMKKLDTIGKQMLASPDQQISLADPDSRSMATSECGSGMAG